MTVYATRVQSQDEQQSRATIGTTPTLQIV